MIALASHADQYWSCYPSIARICDLSRYKKRSLQIAIKHLKERGILMVKTGGGRGGASYYTIIPSALNPASDAPIKADKPRTRNTVSNTETPHHMHPNLSRNLIKNQDACASLSLSNPRCRGERRS